jgi:DNA-binding response OmpR family regulator
MYDLIVLDIIMPRLNGLEVLSGLRSKKLQTPVLLLTALSDENDIVAGLDRGADDYLSKPFSMSELTARVRALLRRRGRLVQDNTLEFCGTTLNLGKFTISNENGSVGLTSKEFEILRHLMEYPDFVSNKEDLILKGWGLDSDFESNNLEVYMSFIRKKLNHIGSGFTIDAVRGVGYKLSPKAE